jgi:sialidase-1
MRYFHNIGICIAVFLVSVIALDAQKREDSIVFSAGDDDVHTYRIPSIVMTKYGTLLAFAEARHDGAGDTGDIDIVVKRSSDGGRTWDGPVVVWDDGRNVCGNPCPVIVQETGRILLLATWNDGDDTEEEILRGAGENTRRVYCLHSDDYGLTWSEPEDITFDAKKPWWTWYATGPCHAIQLGSGRIVVPCNHGYDAGDGRHLYSSHVIYSDDSGASWHLGGSPGVGNECTVAELADGGLMLNMRTQGIDRDTVGFGRLVSISHDFGKSFSNASYERCLIEPVCNGSLANWSIDGVPTENLLFVNPESKSSRKNLTVKVSRDSGSTWDRLFTVTEGPAAYSDILVFPDGSIGVIYECGEKGPYERIAFCRVCGL